MGDLINNLDANSKGEFHFEYDDNLLTLYGENSILGRSVVLHEKEDDLGLGGNPDSKKTGNSGKRIACSIIGLCKSV
jgi:Cu-Zn family superoxide dismutase